MVEEKKAEKTEFPNGLKLISEGYTKVEVEPGFGVRVELKFKFGFELGLKWDLGDKKSGYCWSGRSCTC